MISIYVFTDAHPLPRLGFTSDEGHYITAGALDHVALIAFPRNSKSGILIFIKSVTRVDNWLMPLM